MVCGMSIRKNLAAWAAVLVCAALTACGGGGGGGGSTTPPPPVGNNIVGSWSQDGTVQSKTGASQTVSVAFVTDDGKPATNLLVTQDLGALPTGWTAGNAPVSCAQVSTGNGCVLL